MGISSILLNFLKENADKVDSSDYAGDVMNWQDFFKLSVVQKARGQQKLFFEAELKTPSQFPVNELIISQFQHLELNHLEKKKLSLGIRKILVCHHLFDSAQFKKISQQFNAKVEQSREQKLVFSTQGGGIYLFLALLKNNNLKNKKVVCYTSELPLPIVELSKHPQVQFIYRPHAQSYLTDFSTLWKESDLMELFELKDFKASA